ncbi:hypothetical protein [Cupriavidus taiwanensis]|uniref:hypothetical protein n=1 Tax=Cupriavidus taiwanensis TaxID=164546 RepID=UPI000E1047B5|nr:hypothetical protein [Cupriavidus taiwanensis]SPA50317.1 conserved hypothetical protein; putative membrane protein [Cupriavidus taiwanensis]
MFSAAPDPWLRRALKEFHKGLRHGRVHPLGWTLFVFCAGELLALALLARTLADAIAGSRAGFLWWHLAAAMGLALGAVAALRAWPAWWRGLRWTCTAVQDADAEGSLRLWLEAPGGARREAIVRQCWQIGGATVVCLAPGGAAMPGVILLPWQAAGPELARWLRRSARVALRVQPDARTGNDFVSLRSQDARCFTGRAENRR